MKIAAKRGAALLLSLVLLVGLLAGCAGDSGTTSAGGQSASVGQQVSSAVSQAGSAAGMAAGTYTGVGKGYGGELEATVQVNAAGTLEAIEIAGHNESEEYAQPALDTLPDTIVAQQSLGVDVVAGATLTSRAILAAVADAVAQAGGDAASMGFVPVEDIADAEVVTIIGLPDGEAQITGEQLKTDYTPVTVEAVSISSSGEEKTMVATGVPLEDILTGFGVSQKDYASVITSATDGYSIEIPDSILQTRDIIIAYDVDGEPQSPRTVIPDERAMYWSKFLSKIELMGAGDMQSAEVERLLLLESVISAMAEQSEDFKYYDTTEQALPIGAILDAYIEDAPQFVLLKSIDQLTKNEKYDTFAAQYIMYTGEERLVPLFIGPALPEGMRVKQLLTAQVGTTTLASVAMALEVLALEAGGAATDLAGVPLEKLFAITGMKEAASYTFTAADGYAATVDAADIAKGLVVLDEEGVPGVSFEGLEKNTTVKQLLHIAAA